MVGLMVLKGRVKGKEVGDVKGGGGEQFSFYLWLNGIVFSKLQQRFAKAGENLRKGSSFSHNQF